MTTEQSTIESTSSKRQRRIKHDPEYIFDELTSNSTKSIEENTNNNDLYKPGDIVWSKLGNFPWWPALIYRCDTEGGIYTRTLKTNNKSKQQYFFVYFYGKYLEYAWLSTRSLLNYSGLTNFIQNAELAVEKASTKSEKIQLANRYELKVSTKKRASWDEAIELADQALKMTKDERIQEFRNLLNKNQPKNGIRRKSSVVSDEQPVKKKRGRKPKIELKIDEIEYEYKPIVNNQQIFPSNIPPLSNFELKQIVQSLIDHKQEKNLTFDQAQLFARDKAIDIVYENHNYRMTDISSDWFYDSILLKYPSVVFKYRSWFDHINPNQIPDGTDFIQLKQWQIALMIQAQNKIEQSSNDN